MQLLITILLFLSFLVSPAFSAQSIITGTEGSFCVKAKKLTRKIKAQAKTEALKDAKSKAFDQALAYVRDEVLLPVQGPLLPKLGDEIAEHSEKQKADIDELKGDLLKAYSQAAANVLQSKETGWSKDKSSGQCYKMQVTTEVLPDEKLSSGRPLSEDPTAPLWVQVWTDKTGYKRGDKIKIYFKGNKPFYTRILYKDAKGGLVQLLPNPLLDDNYFQPGAVYELPPNDDRYKIEITPPLGEENIIVYASTAQLGPVDVTARGAFYLLRTKTAEIHDKTRMVNLKARADSGALSAAEFFEDKVVVTTGK